MDKHPHLRALEGGAAAIRAANKTSPYQFGARSFAMLLSVYNASERGGKITKSGLMDRMGALGNLASRGAAYRMLMRLIEAGMIEEERRGWATPIKPSLAGTNYVRAVERYLRNMKWGDYCRE